MGGRGAKSGVSASGKAYGTEYTTVYQSGNIKFITVNEGSTTAPMETMTKGRVYVTVNKKTKEPQFITYYDKQNKRYKQIDLQHPHKINGIETKPHTHLGYSHREKGDRELTVKEQKMVERVDKLSKTVYNILNSKQ